MNPANGPKARLAHMYMPPSSGYFHESHITTTEIGTNIAARPMSQTGSDVGPAAAAVATHCRFVQTITKNNATSKSVRLRRNFIDYTMSILGGDCMCRTGGSHENREISPRIRLSNRSS